MNSEARGGAAKAANYAAQVKTYDDDYWNNKKWELVAANQSELEALVARRIWLPRSARARLHSDIVIFWETRRWLVNRRVPSWCRVQHDHLWATEQFYRISYIFNAQAPHSPSPPASRIKTIASQRSIAETFQKLFFLVSSFCDVEVNTDFMFHFYISSVLSLLWTLSRESRDWLRQVCLIGRWNSTVNQFPSKGRDVGHEQPLLCAHQGPAAAASAAAAATRKQQRQRGGTRCIFWH
jgi:hypothetical protein